MGVAADWVEMGSGRGEGEKDEKRPSRESGKPSKKESWLGEMITAAGGGGKGKEYEGKKESTKHQIDIKNMYP